MHTVECTHGGVHALTEHMEGTWLHTDEHITDIWKNIHTVEGAYSTRRGDIHREANTEWRDMLPPMCVLYIPHLQVQVPFFEKKASGFVGEKKEKKNPPPRSNSVHIS